MTDEEKDDLARAFAEELEGILRAQQEVFDKGALAEEHGCQGVQHLRSRETGRCKSCDKELCDAVHPQNRVNISEEGEEPRYVGMGCNRLRDHDGPHSNWSDSLGREW
jgi:hypothetical protein